jgi:hypothetical protein
MKYLLDVNLLVAWGWADHAGDLPHEGPPENREAIGDNLTPCSLSLLPLSSLLLGLLIQKKYPSEKNTQVTERGFYPGFKDSSRWIK